MSETIATLKKKAEDAREAVRNADTEAKQRKAVAAYDKAFAEWKQAEAAAYIEKRKKGKAQPEISPGPIEGPTPAEAKHK